MTALAPGEVRSGVTVHFGTPREDPAGDRLNRLLRCVKNGHGPLPARRETISATCIDSERLPLQNTRLILRRGTQAANGGRL